MAIRIRLLRAYQVFLFLGVLLVASQVMSAQTAEKAPSLAPQAVQPAQAPGDAKPQSAPVIKFADVIQKIEDEGRATSIANYVAEDVGIKTTQIDSSPVQAHSMNDTQRELWVIDDTGALLFMMKDGDTTDVYLASHAGVLQMAGAYYPGRFHSQEFKRVSTGKAAAAFAAEKEFWLKKTFPSKYQGSAKPEEPVSRPAAKPVKKDSAKDKKLASKAAKTASAKSNQKSNTDGDSAPPKKKISWF